MSNQTWSYYLPEDSGFYFWKTFTHQTPILVFWNAGDCIATDFWGNEYYPDCGRWSIPTHPDPLSLWDRPQPPQLEITNSTKEPVTVRISELKSDYIDNHPEMIEGLDDNRVVWLYGSEIKLLCELHLGHSISQPAISKQIGILIENGLVSEKKDGSIKRFSINREEVNRLGDLVEKLSRVKMGIKRQVADKIQKKG